MITYIIRRFVQAIVVLFIVSIMVFLMVRLLPGDPILMYGSQAGIQTLSNEQLEILRHEFVPRNASEGTHHSRLEATPPDPTARPIDIGLDRGDHGVECCLVFRLGDQRRSQRHRQAPEN